MSTAPTFDIARRGLLGGVTFSTRQNAASLPANPGVNPSLTLTAQTEHLITQVLPRSDFTTVHKEQQP